MIRILFLIFAVILPLQACAETLTVGVFPRRGTEKTIKVYTPFIEYIAKQSGLKLQLDVPPDMPSFWSRLRNGRYDIAHMNQYHYVRAHSEIDYKVILKNEEFGKDTIASAIWVLDDSSIEKLTDLRNKWVIFGGGKQAMVASIMAKDLLQQAGLEHNDYFSRSSTYPLEAMSGLYYRQADAAGVGDVADRMPIVKKTFGKIKLRMLARSERVAQLPWGVKSSLSASDANAFKLALLTLKNSGKGRRLLKSVSMTGISEATDREYNKHREIILRVLKENYFQPGYGSSAR